MKGSRNRRLIRMVVISFFALLLLITYTLLSARNRIVDLKYKDVDYIEIIRDQKSTMKTIKDNSAKKEIVKSLNSLRGKRTQRDLSMENLNHINVYLNSQESVEFVKMGYILRCNDDWYYLNKKSCDELDKIFDKIK